VILASSTVVHPQQLGYVVSGYIQVWPLAGLNAFWICQLATNELTLGNRPQARCPTTTPSPVFILVVFSWTSAVRHSPPPSLPYTARWKALS